MQYKCCGHNAAPDWLLLDKPKTMKNPFTRFTELTEFGDEMQQLVLAIHDQDDDMQRKESNGIFIGKRSIPHSCCKSRMCDNYYSRGCFNLIYSDIARIVFMVKTVAMISSIFQVR